MSWMYLHHVLFGARKHYSGTSWSILKPITLPLYLSLLKITANMFFITDTFSILLFSMGVEQSHLLLIHLPQRGFNNKILLNRISISCMRWAPEKKRYMESRKRGVINTSDKCRLSICFSSWKDSDWGKKYFLCDTLAILNFETLPFLFYWCQFCSNIFTCSYICRSCFYWCFFVSLLYFVLFCAFFVWNIFFIVFL